MNKKRIIELACEYFVDGESGEVLADDKIEAFADAMLKELPGEHLDALRRTKYIQAAKDVERKVVMNLVGLDGNAFALMGAFSLSARRQGWSIDEIKSVTDECTSGDYDNLLHVLMKNTTPEEK